MTTPQPDAHAHHHAPDHGHGHTHEHNHDDEAGLAEILELDAVMLRDHLQEIFDWTAGQAPNPGTIIDLGAGTGTGTFGLAHTFPGANVVAVDQSEYMLGRLSAGIAARELGDRVSVLQADLDQQWPEIAGVDLVWAASSMHHMQDPAKVFGRIHDSLSPNGVVVVVEMDELPRYLPHDLGFGNPGLEDRCHQLVAKAGWNTYPDWSTDMESAGLLVSAKEKFDYSQDGDHDSLVRIAHTFLTRMRSGLSDQLSAEDLAALDDLLDLEGPRGLAGRSDLSMRGTRTVWAARA